MWEYPGAKLGIIFGAVDTEFSSNDNDITFIISSEFNNRNSQKLHGNRVARMACAKHNDVGITGMIPNCFVAARINPKELEVPKRQFLFDIKNETSKNKPLLDGAYSVSSGSFKDIEFLMDSFSIRPSDPQGINIRSKLQFIKQVDEYWKVNKCSTKNPLNYPMKSILAEPINFTSEKNVIIGKTKKQNMPVINMSMGFNWINYIKSGKIKCTALERNLIRSASFYNDLLDKLKNQNIVMFSSAGNDNRYGKKFDAKHNSALNFATFVRWKMGEYNSLIVAGHNKTNFPLEHSNHGAQLSCPGENLRSPNETTENSGAGTSLATSICSGGYAVLSSVLPEKTPEELIKCLTEKEKSKKKNTKTKDPKIADFYEAYKRCSTQKTD